MKRTGLLFALTAALCAHAAAAVLTFGGPLTDNEVNGPTGATGTGTAFVVLDTVAQTLEVKVVYSGLSGDPTGAHIHCCFAQGAGFTVATPTPLFPGFPTGTSGSYDQVLDLTSASSYRAGFITTAGGLPQATAAFIAGVRAGTAYLNLHTQLNPGGEIRALLVPTPEPATFVFTGLGLGVAVLARKRSRKG